jgi:preprotein translocase subunit SecG
MSFLIGLLTVVLVLNCVLLILLVLIQLPKKEAGAGVAFGGAATDALFGAGTGNVLTKVTKYATAVFFLLAVILGVLQSNFYHRPGNVFERKVDEASKQAPSALPPTTPVENPEPAPAASNAVKTPMLLTTNITASPAATTPTPAPKN